jgi:hypothetical protein
MKKQNWEKILSDYLNEENTRPFVWGENDCMTFAAKGVIKMLDRDRSLELSAYGEYDEKKAGEILEAGGGMESIFDKHFKRRVNLAFIQRGDIAIVNLKGTKLAGIVDTSGIRVACKTPEGIVSLPIKLVITAWDIEQCHRQ